MEDDLKKIKKWKTTYKKIELKTTLKINKQNNYFLFYIEDNLKNE